MDAPARAFIAIFPPADVAAEIARAVAPRRIRGDGIAWVRERNLHFTLRFLGALSPVEVAAAGRALAAAAGAPGVEPVGVRLAGPGVFPGPARPRVLWLGAAASAAGLVHLAAAVETALEREGFAPSDRPFTPHLTLGRVRDPEHVAPDTVPGFLAAAFPAADFLADTIVLAGSTLAPGGSIYQTLAQAKLGGGT